MRSNKYVIGWRFSITARWWYRGASTFSWAPKHRAREVLAALSWVGGVTSRDGKLVVSAPVDRSADVNRALAEAGLYASEVRPGMESLERYFLDVTGGAAA